MGRKLLWLSKVRLRMVDLHRSVMTAMGLLGVCQPGSRQTAKFSPRSGRAGRRNSSERRAERAEKNDWVGSRDAACGDHTVAKWHSAGTLRACLQFWPAWDGPARSKPQRVAWPAGPPATAPALSTKREESGWF